MNMKVRLNLWWFRVLLVILLAGWTRGAEACKLEETVRYMAYMEGSNKMRFKFPLYDKEDNDCWVKDGNLYIQIQGASTKECIFSFSSEEVDRDDYAPKFIGKREVGGTLTLYRNRGYSPSQISSSGGWVLCPCVEDQDYVIADLQWEIPNEYRGKKVTISWYIRHYGNGTEYDKKIVIDPVEMNIPAAPELIKPVLLDPMVSFQPSRPNQIMIPYMIGAGNLTHVWYACWPGADGPTEDTILNPDAEVHNLDLEKSSYIFLPAEQCYRKLFVGARYIDSEGNEQWVYSDDMVPPILHNPKRLSADIRSDCTVTLKWSVDNATWTDIQKEDFWEIQRNVSGDPANGQWTSLGQVEYSEGSTEYSFEDKSLISAYEGKKVYYRVRRTITAVWNWGANSGYAMVELPYKPVLPSVMNGMVSKKTWTDEKHEVEIQFELGLSQDGYVILRNADDWKNFANLVANGTLEACNAILEEDIDLGSEPLVMVGTFDNPYHGTFDGNGHTLTFNPPASNEMYTAPFQYVSNAVIRNLHTKGTIITNEQYASGLVGEVRKQSEMGIENCVSSVNLISNVSGEAFLGGFVSVDLSNTLTIRSCLFDGSFDGVSCYGNGGFVGISYFALYIDNCLFAPSKLNTSFVGCETFARVSSTYNFRLTNAAYTKAYTTSSDVPKGSFDASKLTDEELAAAMGNCWTVDKATGNPVPVYDARSFMVVDELAKVVLNIEKLVDNKVRYTERRELTAEEMSAQKLDVELKTSCVDHRFFLTLEQGMSRIPLSSTASVEAKKIETGDDAVYEFDNNVVLGDVIAETQQSSVSLSWNEKRGLADYYRIRRYDKLAPEDTVTLEDNYMNTLYIDRTVRPQHNYRYIVEGVTQCEGNNVSRAIVDGNCMPTGMVRGYVRLPNGTGLAGYTVTAVAKSAIDGAEVKTCVTDNTGFFEIGGLVYNQYGEYTLSVKDPKGEALISSQSVTFDTDVNLHTNITFTQSNYYIFSGYVLYEGSSIPVSGVKFLRDGKEVVDASGVPVTTDHRGAFEVSVPEGNHQIQVVKDGHVFMNGGFFITPDALPDSTWHNWKKDVYEVYLWDKTKVNLMGRVVGGKDQGDLPLGQSLSKNNLGDDITIVLELDGDNTSWIVRDQLDGTVTERHEKIAHGKNDTTSVDAYKHRIVIHPDPKTGEYQLPLYPVKYEVAEVYAKGYPSLFQDGKVSETLDLSRKLNGESAVYSRIYHSQPTLDIWQFTGTNDRFYGIKQYVARDNAGNNDTIRLWYNDKYSLGYPVFMSGATVPMLLSAREEYRYNNELLGELDVVQLKGGSVHISNGLVENGQTEDVALDSVGQASYVFTPLNTTFQLEGDMALRSLEMTLFYEGNYYDINPIKGFVMASRAVSQGRRVVAGRQAHLIDILRDPPGSSSSAYLERGSKLSYSYTADLTATVGAELSIGGGSGATFYNGVTTGTGHVGGITSSSTYAALSYELVTGYYEDWAYNYEFETTERISTSSNVREIGANSDLYIGMMDEVIVEDAIAVRVVNSNGYKMLRPGLGGTTVINGHEYKVKGTAKVLARGWDESKKDSVYLVRDDVLQFSTQLNSTFIHSQHYLLEDLIPNLIRTRNELLLDYTTTSSYAQSLADNNKCPVYVSKVATNHKDFGTNNSYIRFLPKDMQDTWNDSIMALNAEIDTWAGFIATNEKEKLEARELVKVYDFDGASNVNYSETFSTSANLHQYAILPATASIGGDGKGKASGTENKNKKSETEFTGAGARLLLSAKPIVGFSFNYNNGVDSTYSKTVGFTLACSRRSNLSVAVYHENEISADSLKKLYGMGDVGVYYRKVEEHLKLLYDGRPGSGNVTSFINNLVAVPRCRNLVYRTLGGATAAPWEDETRTVFYNPGTVLDQKTMEIDQLRIWAKETSVSNVPYGEPARFTIYMTNESEFPERVTRSLKYYLEDATNAKGAKILVDGFPLTVTGIDLWLEPNTIIEKQVEVYAGADYDYEDLGISLYNEDDAKLDAKRVRMVKLSAHFVPAAGPVNISIPGDKWVVNTESPYEEEENDYYLPVHIDGFDVNFRNFDHIELQYKLSTQGDKDWVNVCSYYNNNEEGKRLMAEASGERKLIDHDGYIDAAFFGEKGEVEQYYDVRAVTYCRQGNGYLTRSSNIVSGIKDTRRPQLFGTPQPEDGILDIGKDIMLRFSEPIAGNYLSAINNFEVLGQTNSNNISLSSSLRFNGEKIQTAFAQSPRNLSGRSFTIDMMLNPDHDGKSKIFFSHGESPKSMELGLTADNRLTLAIAYKDSVKPDIFTATKPCEFSDFREVFCKFDVNEEAGTTDITFYDAANVVGEFTYPRVYEGNGGVTLGQAIYNLLESDENYKGEMLEFRLWNHALNDAEMNSYRQKRLTGSELGLLDNYPLNEGEGNFSYNRNVNGSDMVLFGHTWKMPDGIGMKLDGEKGFRMDSSPFNRFDHEDYTLVFKARTNDNGTLLANGRGKTEPGAKSHFCFSVKNGLLNLNLSGLELNSQKYVNDGQWHSVVLTVNRSRNVGCLYVDQKLANTFAVDTLGGISGNLLAAGATYVDASTVENAITGHIDEIGMYEMALPESVLKTYAESTPTGEEMGMMAYLSFSENKRQLDNVMRLMPSGVSLRRYKDRGQLLARRDTIVPQEVVDRLYDRSNFAPMHDKQEQENLKFSYVADGKDLLINLDVPEVNIEKTNVSIVVKGVNDMQGNSMASPVIMDLYVYRNPLRWTNKHLKLTAKYGEELDFTATIKNLSGKTRNYQLQGLPTWMKASVGNGSVRALDEETITFTISPYTNIGNFEETIYMVSDDGMSEPLPISLKVRGNKPDWAVDEALLRTNISMSIIAQVKIDDNVANDGEDMLAVFNENHRLLGVTNITSDLTSGANDGLAFLNVYNVNYETMPLNFEYFDASVGIIYNVTPEKGTVNFKNNTTLGTTTDPLSLVGERNGKKVQAFLLKKGWNWVSFNVKPEKGSTVKQLLNDATKWQVGDALEAERSNDGFSLLSYKATRNPYDPTTPIYSWDCADSVLYINPTKMYRFYSNDDKVGYIAGSTDYLGVVVKQGWNRIGYMSRINLPLGTALAEYTELGSSGDIVKSQSQFAVLTEDATGNRAWRGTLEFLRVGEGYMLKRNADSEVCFYYPYYYSESNYNNAKAAPGKMLVFENVSATSMTVVAVADGLEVMPGDRLTAYRGAEICGVAEADEQGLFFLSVGDTDNMATSKLSFSIERDEEIIAISTRSQMDYKADAALGTPNEPTAISFVEAENFDDDGWYTTSGIKLSRYPTQKGIYIHKNAKVIIK